MFVSRCRFWKCSKCPAVFEKEDLGLKIKLFSAAGKMMIEGTRECAHCHSIHQSADIYAGKHDVPRQHWDQLPQPVEVPDDSVEDRAAAFVQRGLVEGVPLVRPRSPIGSTIGRWMALIGLPLLSWLMVQGAWRHHVSSGGVPKWLVLFLAGLGAALLIPMGVGLFATMPRAWRIGATRVEYRIRYGIVLGALGVALVCAVLVPGALDGVPYRWFLRINAGILSLLLAAVLITMRRQEPRDATSKGRWKVEYQHDAASPWRTNDSYRSFHAAQKAAGMLLVDQFSVRVLDPNGDEAWRA